MPRRRGYSLLELLVAIAILAVLTGLVLAAVQQARYAAARSDCQNRLRQQGLAVLGYEAAHGRLPPGSVAGPCEALGAPAGVSYGLWPLLLGHLERADLAARYRFDRPFDHPDNWPVIAARIAVLECPLGPPESRPAQWGDPPVTGGVADYGPIDVSPFLADIGVLDSPTGAEGPMPVNGTVRMADITDGASNTVLLAEAGGRPGMAWCAPDSPVSIRDVLAGPHRGSNVCMADGSVRLLRDTLDLRILGRLATRAGGEVVRPEELE